MFRKTESAFFMETIILLGVLEGLLITMLILLKKRKTVSDYWLSVFFLLYSVNTLLSFLEIYNRTHSYPFPAFIFVSSPFLLLHGPAIWMYVKSLTDQHFSLKPIYLLHLVPFFVCLIDFTLRFYIISSAERIEIYESESFKQFTDYPIMIIAMALSSLIYFSWSALMVRKYNKNIKGYFSETKSYDLSWLRIVMVSSAVVYTIIYSSFLIDLVFPVASFRWMHQASFVLGSVYLIVLGFFGHRQGNLFTDKPISVDLQKSTPLSNKNNSIDKIENDFIHSLLKCMNEKKPHLDPEITLSSLADLTSVSPEYLSKMINNQLGKNFYDFINHYRIEEFKTRCSLPENKNFTLISIAFDCGFNSKATFNRVFKNATGETPGDYARKAQGL